MPHLTFDTAFGACGLAWYGSALVAFFLLGDSARREGGALPPDQTP